MCENSPGGIALESAHNLLRMVPAYYLSPCAFSCRRHLLLSGPHVSHPNSQASHLVAILCTLLLKALLLTVVVQAF